MRFVWLFVAVHIIFFTALHFFNPNFFINDDTSNAFLAVMKLQGETAFENHQILQMNYYQFLGQPIGAWETSPLYLPRYVFYGIAKIAGDVNLIIPLEIFCSLLVAGVAFYFLLRRFAVDERWAVVGAFCYAYNGFILAVGRNWFQIAGLSAYLALIFFLLVRYVQSKKGFWWLVAVHAALTYFNHLNYQLYILFFEFLYLILERCDWKVLVRWGFVQLFAVLLSLPIILPFARDSMHSTRFSQENIWYLPELLLTDTVKSALSIPCSVSVFVGGCPSLLYFNPLFYIALLVGAVVLVQLLRKKIVAARREVWLVCIVYVAGVISFFAGNFVKAYPLDFFVICGVLYFVLKRESKEHGSLRWFLLFVLSCLLAYGCESVWSWLLGPLVTHFRMPFKWYLFSQFFVCVWLILLLHRVRFRFWVLTVVCAMLPVYFVIVHYRASNFNTDFAVFDAATRQQVSAYTEKIDGRMIAVAKTKRPGLYSRLLSDSNATYFRVNSFSGSSSLISDERDRIVQLNHSTPVISSDAQYRKLERNLDAFGVEYYLVDSASVRSLKFLQDGMFREVYQSDDVKLYKKELRHGVVFTEEGDGLPSSVSGNSLLISLPENFKGQKVMAGYLKLDENWHATVDGEPVAMTSDSLHRLVIDVKSGAKRVQINYRDAEMWDGVFVSSGVLMVIILWGVFYPYALKKARG